MLCDNKRTIEFENLKIFLRLVVKYLKKIRLCEYKQLKNKYFFLHLINANYRMFKYNI